MDKKTKIPKSIVGKETTVHFLNKLITNENIVNGNKKQIPMDTNGLSSISNNIQSSISTNEDISKLFPDIELSSQILVASVTSPEDMTTSHLNVSSSAELPKDVINNISMKVDEYVDNEYGIKDNLNRIVREALIDKGAWIQAIIPEVSLNQIINGDKDYTEVINGSKKVSLESIPKIINNDILGFIGSSEKTSTTDISFEDFGLENLSNSDNDYLTGKLSMKMTDEDLGIEVTDNFSVLNLNHIMMESAKLASKSIVDTFTKKVSKVSTESMKDADEIFRKLEDTENKYLQEIKEEKEFERDSVGKPLVMKLPVESVIPVHMPGEPEKHLGYWILLDDKGSPISQAKGNTEREAKTLTEVSNKKMENIKKASKALFEKTVKSPVMNNNEEIFSYLVERRLKNSMKNGKLGELIELGDNDDVYRIMMQRALVNKKTKLLFMPENLVSYIAFEYKENGVGKSVLEKTSFLYSLRGLLLMARVMNSIRNSVDIKTYEVELDETMDAKSMSEKIISEYYKGNQTMLPAGITNIPDIVSWIHNLGMRFNFKGGGLPDLNITENTETKNRTIPDDELQESLEKYSHMSMGLNPEMVDNGFSSDFATVHTNNNILFNLRIKSTQKIANKQLTSHYIKLIENDGVLKKILLNTISDNKKDINKYLNRRLGKETFKELLKVFRNNEEGYIEYLLTKFVKGLSVRLPAPKSMKNQQMFEEFDKFSSDLDNILEILITEEALPAEHVGDNIADSLESIRNIVKKALVRDWLADNGYLTKAINLIETNDNGKPISPILEEHVDYSHDLSKVLVPFLKKLGKLGEKNDDKIDNNEEEEDDNSGEDVPDVENDSEEDNSEDTLDDEETITSEPDDGLPSDALSDI